MRLSVALAVSCLIVTSLSAAEPAAAAIRKQTNITAQGLGPALHELAKDREFQILYRTELVGGRRTPGAVGELTLEEALTKLLSGTGLTFEYLDDKTVTILPIAPAVSRGGPATSSTPSTTSSATTSTSGKSFWTRLRLAQAPGTETGGPASQSSTERAPQSAQVEEIIVTAQKRQERLQDVPISIAVLSGGSLDTSNERGVSEALNRIPGVVSLPLGGNERFGGYSNVVIRGISPTVGGASTAYYLDSIPFSLYGNAASPDASGYDLDRVEVLRGPQGTLYGASALNGVVRVLTRDADLNDFQLKTRASAASTEHGDESYRGDMVVNVPVIEGKLGARAMLGHQELGGWIDKPTGKDANDREVQTARLKINAQPTEQLSIGLSGWLSRTDIGAPSYSPDNRFSNLSLDEPAAIDYDAFGMKIGYDFASFSLASMTGYLDYSNPSVLDLGAFGVNGVGLASRTDSHSFSQEVNLSSTHEGLWRWTAGGIYLDATTRFTQKRTTAVFPAIEEHESESFAVFGELTRELLGGKLELTGGLRYFEDRVQSFEHSSNLPDAVNGIPPGGLRTTPVRKFDNLAPRVVLTAHPASNTTLYASYAQGFRSGLNQNFAVSTIYPNFSPADPDKLKNYEFGAKGALWDGKLSFEAAAYYVDWQDVQQAFTVLVAQPNQLEGAFLNAGSASGPGFELAVALEPIDRLALSLAVGWNGIEVDEDLYDALGNQILGKGERLVGSAETTASTSADYGFDLGSSGWSAHLSASANYVSKMILLRSLTSPGLRRSTVMGRGSVALESPYGWTVSLFADNLGNERGRSLDPYSRFWDTHFRPRTIGLQLEYQFD